MLRLENRLPLLREKHHCGNGAILERIVIQSSTYSKRLPVTYQGHFEELERYRSGVVVWCESKRRHDQVQRSDRG
jgi:hypothetical protein